MRVEDVAAPGVVHNQLPAGLVNRPDKLVPVDDVEPHEPGLDSGEHRQDQGREKGDSVIGGEALRHGVTGGFSALVRFEGSRSPVPPRKASDCAWPRAA